MATKYGKCINIGNGCKVADSKQIVEIPDGSDFICPDCESNLVEVAPPKKTGIPLVAILTGIGILILVVGIFLFLHFKSSPSNNQTTSIGNSDHAYLTFAGSNTIGDSLITVLVKSYLEQMHATDVSFTTVKKNEKEISANLDGKKIYIEIAAHGTKTGFNALDSNKTDICMASAPIDDKTFQKFSENHVGEDMRSVDNEHVIGLDGIAVVVNANNPIQEMSLEELRKIYAGEKSDWNKVEGVERSGKINLNRRDDNSGTFKMFSEMAMKKQQISAEAKAFEKSTDIVQQVSDDPNGIGFVSYSFVKNQSGIRSLALKPGRNIQASLPNSLSMKTERYALCRRLFLYNLRSDKNPNIQSFIQFAKTKGQDDVEALGFVSLAMHSDPVVVGPDNPVEYDELSRNAKKISTEFRFRLGKWELDSRSLDDINRLVDFLSLNENKDKQVILVGFTDNVGSTGRNKTLSIQRAEAVKAKLIPQGITVSDIKGFGDAMPVHNNDDEIERSLNRRVEVWLKN